MAKAVRNRMFMLVQYLSPQYYNWTSKNYSDSEIIKNSRKYLSKSCANNRYKYFYNIYHNYYWPMVHYYQHPFNDYKFTFSGSKPRDEAVKIQFHVIMRFCYFYFRDTLRNQKHSKKSSSKIAMPIIASIMHDKDQKLGLDKNKKMIHISIKPHLHFVFRFNKRLNSNQLSRWCGIKPQYFETGKGGRYAMENMMAYLVHAKQPEKYPYDFRDVWSDKPTFNYQKYYLEHSKQWQVYKAKRITTNHHTSASWLAQRVQHGDLTKQDILSDPRYRYIYADNMTLINNAVEFHSELAGELTLMAFKHKRFSLSVFYIWGSPGSGKTFLANKLAETVAKKYHWHVYQGAATNSLDDYSGEQIVTLDDVRSQTMGASDWLKLLDPINVSPNSARYHNRTVTARVIIMTNPEPPAKFFGYMKNVHGEEPLSQFIRRLTQIAHVICTDSRGHEVLLSNINKLNKTYQVPIGVKTSMSGDDTKTITRGTRYVSNPNQNSQQVLLDNEEPENKALKSMVNVIAKKNNPAIKHPIKDKNMIDLEEYLRGDNQATKSQSNPFKSSNSSNYPKDDLPF